MLVRTGNLMRYREATMDDTTAIANLHAESWRATFGGAMSDEFLAGPIYDDRLRVWTQRFAAPRSDQFDLLAEESNELAGFACAYGPDEMARGAFLDNLHVRSGYQGRGIGRELFARVVARGLERYPDSGLYLRALTQNTRALRIYQKLGAADVEGEPWLPPGGGSAPSRVCTWTNDQLVAMARERG